MPQSAEKFLPSTLTKAGCAALALTSALSVLLGEPLAAASAAAQEEITEEALQHNCRQQQWQRKRSRELAPQSP